MKRIKVPVKSYDILSCTSGEGYLTDDYKEAQIRDLVYRRYGNDLEGYYYEQELLCSYEYKTEEELREMLRRGWRVGSYVARKGTDLHIYTYYHWYEYFLKLHYSYSGDTFEAITKGSKL